MLAPRGQLDEDAVRCESIRGSAATLQSRCPCLGFFEAGSSMVPAKCFLHTHYNGNGVLH